MGKEGKADLECHKHSPWKRRNGSTHVGYSEQIALRRDQCGIFAGGKTVKPAETAVTE
jgi:hypothetical protein